MARSRHQLYADEGGSSASGRMSVLGREAVLSATGARVEILQEVEGGVFLVTEVEPIRQYEEGERTTLWVLEEELDFTEPRAASPKALAPSSPDANSRKAKVGGREREGEETLGKVETEKIIMAQSTKKEEQKSNGSARDNRETKKEPKEENREKETNVSTPPPLRKKKLRPPPSSSRPWPLGLHWEYRSSADGIDSNLLIFFHGLGDSEKPFLQLGKRMALPQTALLSLRAPYRLPFDMGSSWFHSFEESGELIQPTANERRRIDSLQTVVESLLDLISWLCSEENGWTHDSLFLFGFSQGGAVVLHLLRSLFLSLYPPLGGAIVVCASFLEESLLASQTQKLPSPSTRHEGDSLTPLLLIHGSKDGVVPPSLARLTLQKYKGAWLGTGETRELDARLEVVEGKGHGMISSQSEMRLVMEFFARHLKRSYPALESNCIEIKPGMLHPAPPSGM